MKKYKLTFNLVEVGQYDNFTDIFIEFYLRVKKSIQEGTSWQALETMHWIEEPGITAPLLFYEARDKAHRMGILDNNGQLSIKKSKH
jgi:hypothetical protein